MEHSFDVNLAAEMGVNASILLKNIVFWCTKHRADNRHFHDGTYWTFSTVASLEEVFPYMTKYGIIAALSELERRGYILVGNYNTDRKDNTKWYAVTDKAADIYRINALSKTTTAIVENDTRDDRNQQSPLSKSIDQYPIVNTDGKNDKNVTSPAQKQAFFNRFWAAYPKKVGKGNAQKAWLKLKPDESLFNAIMDGLRRSKQFDRRFSDPQFVPHPATWLNARGWEDEFEPPQPPGSSAGTPASNAAVEAVRAISREAPVLPPKR